MRYFKRAGFAMEEFNRLRIGPVALNDEVSYYKEVHLLDEFEGRLQLRGLSGDGSRLLLRNEFVRADGILIATVTTLSGWLDLDTRTLSRPPETIRRVLERLARTSDFAVLPSLVSAGKGAGQSRH